MNKVVVLGTAHGHVIALAQTAREIPGVELVGVYGEDQTRRNDAAKTLNIPPIASLKAAMESKAVLALIGAVPSDRANLSQQAVEAGMSVLVDKPLALTHQSLDAVKVAVQKAKRPVSVYYPYRGYPHTRAAKAALDAGQIGKLVRVMSLGPHKLNAPSRPDWHWTRTHNGGALIDIGAHHFDICCWIAGQTPSWISAVHHNFDQPTHKEFQDFAQAQMRFPGGEMAHVEVDWLNPVSMKSFGDTRMWIQGTTGKIEIRFGDEASARIWTDKLAGADLDLSGFESEPQWTKHLMIELMAGREGAIPQTEIWRASQVSLQAFDSAQAQGKAL